MENDWGFREPTITLKTAQMAKEKGFKEKIYGSYTHYIKEKSHPEDGTSGPFGWEKDEVTYDSDYFGNGWDMTDYSNENYICYAAPKQGLLAKWLRDAHHIHVRVGCSSRDYYFPMLERLDEDGTTGLGPKQMKVFKDYEEAFEDGLQEALQIL